MSARIRWGRSMAVAVVVVAAGVAIWGVTARGSASAESALGRNVRITAGHARAEVARLAGATTPEQRGAFADSSVSLDEYRSSVAATVGCLRATVASGLQVDGALLMPKIDVTEPVVSPDGFEITYSYTIDASSMPAAAAGGVKAMAPFTDAELGCQERFQRQVEQGYQTQRRADPAYVDRVTRGFLACARSNGAPGFGTNAAGVARVAARKLAEPATRERLRACFTQYPSVAESLASPA